MILNEDTSRQVSEIFSRELAGNVNLMLFFDPSEDKCPACRATMELVKELASLDGRISVTTYDMSKNQKEARFLGVDKVPALVIGGKKIYNMLYFGMPTGYEFSSLLEDIVDASKGATRLSERSKDLLKSVSKPVDIKVFVTPTCPYCPKAVRIAHQFAMENPKIRSSMIDAQEYMEMSRQYEVIGVPRIVINDSIALEGAQPEEVLLQHVLDVGK